MWQGNGSGAGGAILGRRDREGLPENANLRRHLECDGARSMFKFRGKCASGKKVWRTPMIDQAEPCGHRTEFGFYS